MAHEDKGEVTRADADLGHARAHVREQLLAVDKAAAALVNAIQAAHNAETNADAAIVAAEVVALGLAPKQTPL